MLLHFAYAVALIFATTFIHAGCTVAVLGRLRSLASYHRARRSAATRGTVLSALVLAALGFASAAAAPPAGRADETGAGVDVSVPARDDRATPATNPPPDATAKPWWRPTTEGPWRFTFGGYGWLPDAPAEIDLGPVDETLPENLGTLLDDLQFTAMLDLELRKGSFGAYFAPLVIFLEDTEHVRGPIEDVTHKITIDEHAYLMDFGLTYEVGRWQLWNRPDWILPSPAVTVEPFVGGRALIDTIKIKIDPGRTVDPEIEFVAPVVGLRTFWDLTDRLNLLIEGDYGGFDVDNLEETYNALGLVGWRFKPKPYLNINVYAGYRFLRIDYKKIAEITVDIKGPLVGVAFEFSSE